ncbi:MAG: anti-sigma factor, partial [Vulcanimicrobiaceae bacterium]
QAAAAPIKNRAIVWPAYLVAAACFAIALVSTLVNLSLVGQLRQAQTTVAQLDRNSSGLARSLAQERTTLADIMDDNAQRFPVNGGDVVRVRDKLYITMHDVPAPPRGKVYQAWTLPKGSNAMAPSVTFVPDHHGVAVISLPVDARQTAAVAVSIEPDGGSKQPTSKPTFVVSIN